MGFLKNIGKSIKKNVSLKNIVKIATPLMGAIPIAGGLLQSTTESIVAAKEAKKAQNAQNAYDAEQLAQQAKAQSLQMAGAIAQSTAQNFGDAVFNSAYDGIAYSAKQATAKAGVTIADMTITEWFKKNWWKVAGGLSAFFLAIWFLTRNNGSRHQRLKPRLNSNGRPY